MKTSLCSTRGSNTSIPDLLKKHNERVRQAKSRPESATVQSRTRHTKPKPRPQSAKELGAQEAGANKKPPKGFGGQCPSIVTAPRHISCVILC